MNNTLTRHYSINSYDIDTSGQARLTALANFLQETAYKHASELGVGYSQLESQGKAWILSRFRITVNKYPLWDENISIETWPRGIEKLFALRDFNVFNASGEMIANAATCWLMVDTNTHRPCRIPDDFLNIITRTDSVYPSTPGKIKNENDMQVRTARDVTYFDLDIVGHVNNVKYIEWCLDEVGSHRVIDEEVVDFIINFTGEALLGQRVEILTKDVSDNEVVMAGQNLGSGRECFLANLKFRPR